MNSEAYNEIMRQIDQPSKQSSQTADMKAKEDIAIEKGDIIVSMMAHAGWKLIKSQLEEVKLRLQEELSDVSKCDTLRKVQNRQYLVTAIELFLNSPKLFIEKRNSIISRRQRWQNKRP